MSPFPQILLCDGTLATPKQVAKGRPNKSVTAAIVQAIDEQRVTCRIVMIKNDEEVQSGTSNGYDLAQHLKRIAEWNNQVSIHALIISKNLEKELRLGLAGLHITTSIIPYDT